MNTGKIIAAAVCAAAAVSVWADQPFRDHRYDSFKATPTESGQIVFAGNSITNMHSWFEAFGSHQEVIGRGNSGGYAYELLDNLESYIDSKPSKFFMMIGTNDVSSGESAEITARRIMTIVRRVRLESPETEIYLETILPRSSNPKPDYEECNSLVKAAVEALNDPKVRVVNLSEVCAPLNGNSTWSYDGLHPRPIGYSAWTHHIEDMVGYQSVYPETITSQDPCGAGNNSNGARVEQFPYYPVKEGDVLFFGDEQVHGGEWHELMRSDKVKDRAQCWGWGGISLTAAKNVVKSSLQNQAVKPSKIFLFYGVGDKNLTNYRLIVDEAKTQAPEAGIYLVSLTPSTNTETNDANITFNNSLKEIAKEKDATYVDIHSALSADLSKNIMGTNYVSGRGYIVMANELAKHIDGVNPVSLTEYDAVYAGRTNRKIIGDALTAAFMIEYGDKPGMIKEKYREGIEAAALGAASIINDANLTTERATEKANAVNAAIAEARNDFNYPLASTVEAPVWYTLTSARGGKAVTSSSGKLIGTVTSAVSYGYDVWQFIDRGDETYDIRNANGEYINPTATYNTQMSTMATAPDRGFSLSYSENGTGNFVIYTSDSQLNQTNLAGLPVYNWYSAGASTPDRNDQGCAYSLAEYDGTIEEPAVIDPENAPLQSGWYEIKHAADGKTLTNMAPMFKDTNNPAHSYSLQYISTEAPTPKEWLYITVDGENRTVRCQNGFYLSEYMTNSRTAANQAMTVSTGTPGAYDVRYWVMFTRGGNSPVDMLGRSSNATTPHYFRHVAASEVAQYDVWTVNIVANPGAQEIIDTHVTLASTENHGIATVYNGGTYFLTPGTTISAADLTITAPEGVAQEHEQPLVTIADGTITIDYTKDQGGISEVGLREAAEDEAYDIWGRRARTPRHGLYIVNGRKVRL